MFTVFQKTLVFQKCRLRILPGNKRNKSHINQMNCFAVNGSQDSPIDVQPILPDLSGFELRGNDKIHDCDCQKWQKQEQIGHKLNKYTIWLKVENDVTVPAVSVSDKQQKRQNF